MPGQTLILVLLAPIVVVVGATVVLGLSLGSSQRARAAVAPASLLTLLLAAVGLYFRPADMLDGAILNTTLGAYVMLIALLVGILIVLVSWNLGAGEHAGEMFAMMLFSIAALMVVGLANDLVTLFVAVELVSIPTYVLVAAARKSPFAQEASLKYFFLGAMTAAVTAYGFSILYGLSGTTLLSSADSDVATVASALHAGSTDAWMIAALLLSLAALLFKMAAVPFHVYAADVYQGAHSAVTGMLGFVPKAAGLVAIIKLLACVGWDTAQWQWVWPVLWVLAILTMTAGNVIALLQTNVKRILAYSSIAHSGYLLIGVLAGPVANSHPLANGLSASLFYIFAYGIMNLGAFGVLAYLRHRDDGIEELADLQGLAQRHSGAALALAVCVFSLLGMPPTAGFLGKVYLLSAALADGGPGMVALVVIAVINTAISAAYYLRIVGACYFGEPTVRTEPVSRTPALPLGLAMCAVLSVAIGVFPSTAVDQAWRAVDRNNTISNAVGAQAAPLEAPDTTSAVQTDDREDHAHVRSEQEHSVDPLSSGRLKSSIHQSDKVSLADNNILTERTKVHARGR